MKVFVTGGAGYIGSVTSKRLLDAGHSVVVFDSLERGHRAAVDPRARLLVGDLRNAVTIRDALAAERPDAVVHFAAFAYVGESMENPGLYFANNVGGGINLAEAMRLAGVKKLVFSSTCATYGYPEQVPMEETLPQRPINPYGESKLQCERVFLWYEQLCGLQPVFLRYFNACGADLRFGEDHRPETHLIPLVLDVARGRRPHITVFGEDYATPDGTCIRDYIHVLDLAQAHVLALEKSVSGPFNLGNGDGCSVREVIAAAREVTGHAIPEQVAPRRPGDPDRLVAASAQARRVLGWKPEFPALRDILRSAWTWQCQHPQGYGET
ncbi:MAG: UDP-glucose 4-epimerase GalE [bacterium]